MDRNAVEPGLVTALDESAEAAEAQDADPASYRDLTKEEVLDRIAAGYQSARAGMRRPLQDLLDELDEIDD